MKETRLKGIYFALLTAFISGVSIFVNKFAVTAIKPPLLFTSSKNLLVGLLIISILLLTKKYLLVRKLTRRELVSLILISVVGGTIPFYLFFTGFSEIPAVTGAIIQKTLVFWVVLLAIPFLKEKITKTQALAVFLLFASNLIVGGFNGFKFTHGEFYVLLATLFWAAETIIAKKALVSIDPDIVTGFRMGLGSLMLILATIITVPSAFKTGFSFSTSQLFWLGLTVVTLLMYVSSWYRALKMAPAVLVTSILVVSTLITNLLSAVFITHTWNYLLTTQTILMVVGVLLYCWTLRANRTVVNTTVA